MGEMGPLQVVSLSKNNNNNQQQQFSNRITGNGKNQPVIDVSDTPKTATIEFGRIPGFNGTLQKNPNSNSSFGYELSPLKGVDRFKDKALHIAGSKTHENKI